MSQEVVTLKEFLLKQLEDIRDENDRRFAAQEKAVETAFNAAKEAVIKSEIGVEKRSDAVYVTITKLQDALAAVMPRAEAEQRFAALADKIDELKASRDETTGGKKVSDLAMGKIYAFIAAVGVITSIIISMIVLISNNKL